MIGFFKKRRNVIFLIGVLCVLLLSGTLLTTGMPKADLFIPLKLIVYPKTYAATMSSTPGISILVGGSGNVNKVEYSTNYGKLITWDNSTGKITEQGKKAKVPVDVSVYWSPLVNGQEKTSNGIIVKATILNNNKIVAKKQVKIKYDPETYLYSVEPSADVIITNDKDTQANYLITIHDAVSIAIKSQRKSYGAGDVATEGHIILNTEDENGKVKVYTISSFGAFGFENGIFTIVSGSGLIPIVMTFSRNDKGEYSLLEYKEPIPGRDNWKSTKALFPKKLWDKVLMTDKDQTERYRTEIYNQQETQAIRYLQSIGRNAPVSREYVNRESLKINVEASNKIFAGLMKYDLELNSFPFWIGSKELIENGVRYVYKTSQSKTSDGYDLVTFMKTEVDGTLVKQYKYKIVGNDIEEIK